MNKDSEIDKFLKVSADTLHIGKNEQVWKIVMLFNTVEKMDMDENLKIFNFV
jgi:hypothetical protein